MSRLSRLIPSTQSTSDKKLANSIKNLTGFTPNNIALYKLAFRHSSIAKELKNGVKDSNERLEYLGDAIIGAVVSDYLFKKYPFQDEGFLSKIRSKLVSRANHNKLALKLGLDSFVQVHESVTKGKSSIIGDAFEALIGAIYLDKGFATTYKSVSYTHLTLPTSYAV